MLRTTSSILSAASVLAAIVAPVACTSPGSPTSNPPSHTSTPTVTPSVHIVTQLPKLGGTTVMGIIGSYHSCAAQADDTSWVLDTSGNAGFMETLTGLSAPSVELNDANCALQVDGINTSSIGYTSTDLPTALVFTGPSVTPNAYLPSAVGFDTPDAGPLSFYANAQSTVTNGSADFALTILMGATPITGSPSTTATPQVVTGSLSAVDDVPPPNYTADFSSFALKDDINGVASTVSGAVLLDFGTQDGEALLTVKGQDLSTESFQQIDTLFHASKSGAVAVIPPGNGSVSDTATNLVAVGDTLPETSSIVVQHVDSASNVTTYEVLAITFFSSGS